MANRYLELIRRLRQLNERAGQAIEGSPVPDFVAQDPATVPDLLRPYQWAQRRSCDGFAATGAFGQLLPAGRVLNALCRPYLGDDTPEYSEGAGCPVLTLTYYDINVSAPGRPEQGPFTADVPAGYELKKSEEAILGFAGGCIYAEGPGGEQVALSCTNFPQFNQYLEITQLEAQCKADGPPGGEPGYRPTRPDDDPGYGPNFPNLPGWPDLEIDIQPPFIGIDGFPNFPVDFGDGPFNLAEPLPGDGAPEVPPCVQHALRFRSSISGTESAVVNLPTPAENARIVGIFVHLEKPDLHEGWIVGTYANRVTPGELGTCALLCETDEGQERWDSAIKPESHEFGLWTQSELISASKFEISVLPGYTWTVTPIERYEVAEEQ